MGYKLIALDVDGTLRTNSAPPSERVRNALRRVREAGAIVTLATGRTLRSALRASAEADITSPIAASQGAQIADPTNGRVLFHRPLTVEMARMVLEALNDHRNGAHGSVALTTGSNAPAIEVVGYGSDEIYVREMTPWAEGYKQRVQVTVNVVGDWMKFDSPELTRFVVVGNEGEIQKLETSLKSVFDTRLHITRSLAHFCEILHPDTGKHNALAWLCRDLGIRREDTIAFGNGYNDVHMLEWAGLGIAVGGAVPEVAAAADIVAPPIEEDGLAQVLEDFLNKGLIG